MSADRDTDRIVRSWLEEGVTALPDQILDAVLQEVPATPQRRFTWWPARRLFDMNKAMAYGLAAAAIVIVAILGFSFLAPAGLNIGDQAEPSTPTPTPTAPAAGTGQLEPGTYRVDRFTHGAFTITVPSGWSRDDNFVFKGTGEVADTAFDGDGVYLATWVVSHVYSDSCQWEGALREASSIAEITEALTEQTGHDTTGPVETELGGYPATRFEFSVPSEFDVTGCDRQFLRLWPDAGPNENVGLPIVVGQTATVYLVDIDGAAQLVITGQKERSTAADVAELEDVLSSITFERP